MIKLDFNIDWKGGGGGNLKMKTFAKIKFLDCTTSDKRPLLFGSLTNVNI